LETKEEYKWYTVVSILTMILMTYFLYIVSSQQNSMVQAVEEIRDLKIEVQKLNNFIKEHSALPKKMSYVSPEDLESIATASLIYGYKFGHDPNELMSIVFCESSFKKDSLSNKSAKGVMQINPITAKHLNFSVEKSDSIWYNMYHGSKYLRELKEKFRNKDKALLAYYRGPGAVMKDMKNQIQLDMTYPNKINKWKNIFKRSSGS
jgi:membrane-bound lytic murein transglycosylase MltF